MDHSSLQKLFPDSFLNSTVLYLLVTDSKGEPVLMNSLFSTRFSSGLPNSLFEGVLTKDDLIVYKNALQTIREFPGKPVSIMVRCTDRADAWMRWEISTVMNEKDSIENIIHIGYDNFPPVAKPEKLFGLDNEKIRFLVNHIPGAIYRCRGDESFTLEFFSDEIEKLTGYPLEYFRQNREDGYIKLVYEEDRDRFLDTVRLAIAGNGKFEIEYRIVPENGEMKWVFESGKVNDESEDGVIYVDGCIFDITERKQMEADLKKSEDEVRRLALVAHNTTNSVMITDADENIIWINDGYTRISGFTLEEIRGKKIGYSLEREGADPQPLKKIRRFLEQRLPYKEEFVSYTKTGDPIWLEVECHPLKDEQGNHLGFMAVENDITQRKQTIKEQEELVQRLSLATDSAKIGIFEINLSNNGVIWDDRMYEIYDSSKDQGLSLYKIFFKALHPEDAQRMSKIIEELLSGKKRMDEAIYRIILPDGRVRHIESHAITRKSESGSIVSLIGTNRDITEAVLVQEKIKSQNKVLRDIAFIQSHEVRRPLANILGVIEILQNSGALKGLEIFDHLVESAKELDQQIRAIVNKANEMDDEVFR